MDLIWRELARPSLAADSELAGDGGGDILVREILLTDSWRVMGTELTENCSESTRLISTMPLILLSLSSERPPCEWKDP